MVYEYNVFLSYRRFGEWPNWVKDVFLPLFEHWLGEELGKDPRVAWDERIETGVSWPIELAAKLAQSRVMVSLWSRQYFNSAWCKAELAHMMAREKKCGFRVIERPEGLIVPAIIHDGQYFPHYVSSITPAQLQKFSNVRLAKNSPTEEALSAFIAAWVRDIAAAIERAPPYDEEWHNLAVTEFLELWAVPEAKQATVPSLGEAP